MTLADPGRDLDAAPAQRQRDIRRVVLSSYLGSTVEFYDFILYATASSLVFGPVFFADLNPGVALIASYATFAIGYISRPLGGIVFGHFGDRVGRKKMLMWSMSIMGIASFLIGLVPAIPTWGAVMLIVLRAVQGIAIGGEWGGAALMSLEHVKGRNRGFAAAFTNAGGPTGAVLGTIALSLVALMPEDDFLGWGWRIPFLFSAILLAVGLFVRARIAESPVFEEALHAAKERTSQTKESIPLVTILRAPRTLILAGLVCTAPFVIQALFSTFVITYAAENGVTRSQGLTAFAICQFFAIFGILGAAKLSDQFGRKPIMLTGFVGMVVLAWPLFQLASSGNFLLVVLAFLIACSVLQSLTFGPMPAFLAEQFGTRARYTGASLGYQIGSLLGAGFTPVIVASLFAGSGTITSVIVYLVALCAMSTVILTLFVSESKHVDLSA
ncbi:MFS transporter [Rhodococcus sp. NPDC056960]|uniref:MFS transporter n=1 Tax=Rhodococcus sp. NPDC056960 TaxID=3345982 RepID=UPI00362BF72C